MTRSEAIARAVIAELKRIESAVDAIPTLRAISFDVKLKPGTNTVRTVIVRSEFEHDVGVEQR
jgi:hypothetical protein